MNDLQAVFEGLFSNTMRLLNLEVLNIGITYFELFVGFFVASLAFPLLGMMFGVHFTKAVDTSVSGAGGNSSNIEVDPRFEDPDYKEAFDELTRREHMRGLDL